MNVLFDRAWRNAIAAVAWTLSSFAIIYGFVWLLDRFTASRIFILIGYSVINGVMAVSLLSDMKRVPEAAASQLELNANVATHIALEREIAVLQRHINMLQTQMDFWHKVALFAFGIASLLFGAGLYKIIKT